MKLLKLHLGCRDRIIKGFINIDIIPHSKEVKKVDLNNFPLPWKTNSVDYIHCEHLLVFLKDPPGFLHELHRICKPNARINLIDTHYSLAMGYAELRRVRPGISYFMLGHKSWNSEFYNKFKVRNKFLNFTEVNYTFLNKIINPLINLSPVLYERFFSYILPCSEVHFDLKVIKFPSKPLPNSRKPS
jgi:predicted SAM-dependent methyltransferase